MDNQRLFVSNIPKNKDRDELIEEFGKLSGEQIMIGKW
jgi:hypothetical protein